MDSNIKLVISMFCFIIIGGSAQAQAKISPNDWAIFSENDQPAKLKDTVFLGKESLMLDGKSMAVAFKNGGHYKNFRMECDIAGRVMSGFGFRAKDHQNYHFLYFRPGYGGTEEAIQYIPIYNGSLSWTLYPSYQKTADIKQLQWFHASLEVRDNKLRVWVNGGREPQMEIELMDSNFSEGDILLRSMFGDSYFANFYVTELPETLSDWQISEQFPRKEKLDLDPNTKSSMWIKAKPDQGGIINISRYIDSPMGVVIAKHNVKADVDRDMSLYFDFTGKLKIFLNGAELFYYEKQALDRTHRGAQSIVLHLKKGDNDLRFVSEGDATIFGKGYNAMGRAQHQNWGFSAELVPKR